MLGVKEAASRPAASDEKTVSRRKSRTVDVVTIEAMDRDDCIERWQQMFGVAPPKYTSLEFMRKALAYEAQVKAFGGHSNAVQRALKASLKPVRSELETGRASDREGYACTTGATTSYAKSEDLIEGATPNAHQTIRRKNRASDANNETTTLSNDSIKPSPMKRTNGEAETSKTFRSFRSPKPARNSKPSVLSIRAGTHLVREWNGRTRSDRKYFYRQFNPASVSKTRIDAHAVSSRLPSCRLTHTMLPRAIARRSYHR